MVHFYSKNTKTRGQNVPEVPAERCECLQRTIQSYFSREAQLQNAAAAAAAGKQRPTASTWPPKED